MPQLKVVFDQVGTPTYAYDLAQAITTILKDYEYDIAVVSVTSTYPKNGIYHYSNEGVCSWFDFAKLIAGYAGNEDCDVQSCHSDDFPSLVKRPAFSVLDKTKIKETFGIKVPYWIKSLIKCLEGLIAH